MADIRVSHFVHDLLLSKTDFVFGDFPNGNRYLGFGSSTVQGTATNAPYWDTRQYRQIQLWVQFGALTSAGTPAIEVNIDQHPLGDATQLGVNRVYSNIPAGGTPLVLVAGAGSAASGGGGTFTAAGSVGIFCPPYMRIRFVVSGGPLTALGSPTILALYGIR